MKKKRMSKNILAVLILLVLIVSMVGAAFLFTNIGEVKESASKAQVKLNVLGPNPATTGAVVKLNVIKKS